MTRLLAAYSGGDPDALDRLMPLLYEPLKRIAHARLRNERAGHTLNTTGLVHEAYVRLVDINRVQWEGRAHFLAVASRVMRRILINYARDRKALKRGGGQPKEELDEERLVTDDHAEALLELDDVLQRFEALYPRPAEAVLHRYFGGLTNEETAEALGVSLTTVERDLRFARAWLARAWGGALPADVVGR
ncbi:MAG: sigma-70 family RNA polymerase sigma factor [Rhodothermales bacterium]|nr:sigma-70 family RNA polymerase sigma factor [Rhodothermales bacterium]